MCSGQAKTQKIAKTRVAVFALSYSHPFATLCLFLSPMGHYTSMLLNMGSTDFICIAESNLHLLYTSKWAVWNDALLSFRKSILRRCTIEFVFIRDSFGVKWLGKSSRIAAVLDLAKRQHNRAKSGIPSQHSHFHPFRPHQLVKPAQLFAPHKSCNHYRPKEVCQAPFRPWGEPWLRP